MPLHLFQNEYELGLQYLKTKQYDRALERASEAFRLAKALEAKSLPPTQREKLTFNAGETLYEAYSATKRKDEALNTVIELFQLALDLPHRAGPKVMNVSSTRRAAAWTAQHVLAKKSPRRIHRLPQGFAGLYLGVGIG